MLHVLDFPSSARVLAVPVLLFIAERPVVEIKIYANLKHVMQIV